MTLRTKILLGVILAAFAAFHAAIWYNVALVLAAPQTTPAGIFGSSLNGAPRSNS